MSADTVVIPPHIAAVRDDYFAVVLVDSPRALEIVDEAFASERTAGVVEVADVHAGRHPRRLPGFVGSGTVAEGEGRMTTLQENLLSWLLHREEYPTRRDLFAEWPHYRQVTLERAMDRLVRDGRLAWTGTHWTTP